MFKHQAASSKQASAGIKQQASSIKQHALRNWALDSGKKLRNLVFSDSQFLMRGFLLD
jgi:hypothetical protein